MTPPKEGGAPSVMGGPIKEEGAYKGGFLAETTISPPVGGGARVATK